MPRRKLLALTIAAAALAAGATPALAATPAPAPQGDQIIGVLIALEAPPHAPALKKPGY